jgi:serine phosphatase RsbU (regulator of sigma subunit)
MLLEGQPAAPNLKATRTRGNRDMGPLKMEIIERSLAGRDALLVRDIFEDTPPPIRPSIRADPIRSVMCAPLWSTSKDGGEGRLLGIIYLDSLSDGPPLTDRDLQILIMLANITATKIDNERLFEESLQKRRIEEDMRLAAEIQSHLLPGASPVITGYRVFGTTEPCRMVGGDYFDFDYDGRSLLLALADVSGKGSGAAMLMVALRAMVRAHWRDCTLPEATCRINRSFHLSVPPDKYATFFVARLDPASGRLDYVNAGHNRPLVIRPDGKWQRLETGGTVLGAFPEVTYEQGSVDLAPGSCLLVFSDGISDAWHNQEEADRQLVNLVQSRKPGDVAALCADIFGAAAQAKDDRTLIFLERLVTAPRSQDS